MADALAKATALPVVAATPPTAEAAKALWCTYVCSIEEEVQKREEDDELVVKIADFMVDHGVLSTTAAEGLKATDFTVPTDWTLPTKLCLQESWTSWS